MICGIVEAIMLRDDVLKVPFLKKGYYNRQFERINQYLAYGDTQPAVVSSLNPLVISAYSDEMDAGSGNEICFEIIEETFNLDVGEGVLD